MTFHFKKGQATFLEGDKKTGFYFIKRGKIKCTKSSENGREIILKFLNQGEMLGQSILTNNYPCHEFSAICLEDSELCYIPYQMVKDFVEDNLSIFRTLSRLCHQDTLHFCNVIMNVNTKSVRERIAISILHLYEKFGIDEEGYIDIVVTREEIANMSATTTESAIRFISEFKSENLIKITNKKIRILDLTKFQKTAGIKSNIKLVDRSEGNVS